MLQGKILLKVSIHYILCISKMRKNLMLRKAMGFNIYAKIFQRISKYIDLTDTLQGIKTKNHTVDETLSMIFWYRKYTFAFILSFSFDAYLKIYSLSSSLSLPRCYFGTCSLATDSNIHIMRVYVRVLFHQHSIPHGESQRHRFNLTFSI